MLYIFVLILSVCALIYEFLLSTLSSYLIGNSILQFSLTIGFFLSGIGLGSFFSRYVTNGKITFFYSEIILGFLGGFSTFLIKFSYIYFFNYLIIFYFIYFFIVIFIGMLVGFEIPILGNLVGEKEEKNSFKKLISDVFTYDYAGAIIATFLFPFVLLPFCGLTYTAIILGFLNMFIALLFLFEKNIKVYYLEKKIFKSRVFTILILIIIYLILAFFIKSRFENFWDHFYYKEPIILKTQSKYQEIVLTKRGDDIRLILDGHLQFMSLDEKRYHDALSLFIETKEKEEKNILTGEEKMKNISSLQEKNILILGGGDGLIARNIIHIFDEKKFNIDLVDLDQKITDIAKTNNILLNLNSGSLLNKNVSVINKDAFGYVLNNVKNNNKKYDYIISDLTDPRDVGISKLYSKEFYMMIKNILKKDGIFVTQSGNAFFGKESFWCINKTLNTVFKNDFEIIPYKTYLPSFGDWGFNAIIPKNTNSESFYSNSLISTKFDRDYLVDLESIKVNTIENPIIIKYYTEGWHRFSL